MFIKEQYQEKLKWILENSTDEEDKKHIQEYLLTEGSHTGKEMIIEKIINKYPDIAK